MSTRAVIFDVDGTLIDTNDLHTAAWVEAFRRFGVEVDPEDIRRQMGKGGDQLMPSFLPPDLLQQKGRDLERFRVDLFQRVYLPRARAFPGVRELFERIRADGHRILLASSSKAEEVEHYKSLANVADLIDGATSADDAEHSKPYPDIFQAALKRLRPIRPEEAVVVGDSPYDAEAARGADLRMVGVLCGGFDADALCAAGCIAVYRDARDLLNRYETSPLHNAAAQGGSVE
jgi:HAD superfamily hydrolase (TIGR01509 family)